MAAEEKVIIYTKPECPHCNAAKTSLSRQGIPFREVDVTTSPEALEEMLRYSGGERRVPVIVSGDKVSIGWEGRG